MKVVQPNEMSGAASNVATGDQCSVNHYYRPPPIRRDGDGYSPDDEWGSEWRDCDDTNSHVTNLCPAPYAPVGCPECDPIVMPLTNVQSFKLTDAANGVSFDLDGDGTLERIAWTSPDAQLAFLAIDRNSNGKIDNGTELFGGKTVPGQNTGFAALNSLMPHATHDLAQGGATRIDANGPIWSHLLLWHDANHNGVSEPTELRRLSDLYTVISANYEWHNRRDRHGNLFQYRALARWRVSSEGSALGHPIYDVFFVKQQ